VKAVILAAGEGKRMHPLTATRPKVMIPIVNKPIVEHLLGELAKAGIKEFIFIVGYRDEQVRGYFAGGEKWGVSIDYCTQRKQLGTADAIRGVESLVDGRFILVNGDVIVNHEDVNGLMSESATTMSVFEVGDTEDLGTVEVEGNRIVRIHEKARAPSSHLANAGMYLLTPEIFAAIAGTSKSPRGEYEITDSLQWLIDNGSGVCCRKISYWLDVSFPWDLLTANEELLKGVKLRNLGTIEENAVVSGDVSIGSGTVVRSGSYIIGPVVIGENCDVGPNCFIRPCTAIGNGCHIGAAVEVKNSVIMNGSKIPHHNYVGDSVIGECCNLGSGTKIANLRLDGKDIWVNGRNTRRRKLGAIIGDGVGTGINVSINIGTVIGSNAHIGPGAYASGVIAPDTLIL